MCFYVAWMKVVIIIILVLVIATLPNYGMFSSVCSRNTVVQTTTILKNSNCILRIVIVYALYVFVRTKTYTF